MRRRLVVAPVLQGASVAAALSLCPAAYASSVHTVFSAENALYGAGYAVGQADGWIDDSLRAAINQYQTDRPGLASTGELDSSTLAALGISAQSSQLLGGNTVATRSAAMATLGLSETQAEPVPALTVAAPEPEPVAPEPKPEPVVVKKPEPKAEKQPEPDSRPVEIVASAPQPAEPAPKAESAKPTVPAKTVAVAEPEPVKTTQPEQQPSNLSDSEPTSEPVQVSSSFGPGENSSNDKTSEQTDASTEEPTVVVADNSVGGNTTLPQEPTAMNAPEANSNPESGSTKSQTTKSQSTESQGNVLTKVFDFLFGWMV